MKDSGNAESLVVSLVVRCPNSWGVVLPFVILHQQAFTILGNVSFVRGPSSYPGGSRDHKGSKLLKQVAKPVGAPTAGVPSAGNGNNDDTNLYKFRAETLLRSIPFILS